MNPTVLAFATQAMIMPYLIAGLLTIAGGHADHAVAVKTAKAMSHGHQTAYQAVWQPEALLDKRPVAIHLRRAGW